MPAIPPNNYPPQEDWICRTIQVPNDPAWWSMVTGLLVQGSYGWYWDKKDERWEDARDLAAKIFYSWINQSGCTAPEPELEECTDYTLDSSIIEWAPNDPFRSPLLIPSGYALPPWYVVGVTIPYVGLQPGDVITDLLHSPFNTLASGFPRFRVNVDGAGTVELHMLRFPTASIVFITIDDNPVSSRWQDLNSTLSPVGGAFDPVSIIEVAIAGSGKHHIDVTIVSAVGESFPFVHFGGGIRKIVLCGFAAPAKPLAPIIEWEDDMSLCQNVRWNDGVLQILCCGEWEDVPVFGEGPIPGDTTQPSSGARPAAGQSTCFNRSLNAKDTFLIPFGVQNGDVIAVSNITGAWSSASLANWTCADGTPFVLGQCIGSRGHDGGDPDGTLYHGQLIIAVDGQYFSATDGEFTLSGLSAGQHQAVFMPNFTPSDSAGGTVQFRVCVQNGGTPPPTAWCRFVDFTLSDYGFGAGSANIAYTPGSGFEGTGACNGDHTVQFPTPPVDQVITKLTLYFSTPPLVGGLLCTYVTGIGCIETITPDAVSVFNSPGLNGTQANNVVLWESGSGCTTNAVLAAMQIEGTGTPPDYGVPC